MKAMIFVLVAAALFTGGISFSGCQTAAQKEQAAQDKLEASRLVEEAKAIELAKAKEWNEFKSEYEAKIQDNEIRILELKEKMRKSGKKVNEALAQRIEKLEQKNKDLRIRIANYDQSQTDWESFKREFNHDMDELGKALKDLTVDNKN
jgi:uncharacterized protein YeaO (DUF488 family)